MARIEFKQKEYQGLIIDYIENTDRGAIWAGMGMGKTSSTLTALDRRFLQGYDRPVLVLAPKMVAVDIVIRRPLIVLLRSLPIWGDARCICVMVRRSQLVISLRQRRWSESRA